MAPVTTSSRDSVGQWPTLTTDKVAQEFIQIYYNLLNRSPGYLHQLYGDESTAIISEAQDEGPPQTVHASSKEKIKQLVVMFSDVHVVVTTCTPQYSMDGSLLLLVTGRMLTKTDTGEDLESERLFTQAFVLAKQDKGFYVRTDTLQVHSRGCSFKFLRKATAPPAPRVEVPGLTPVPAPASVPAPQSPPRQPERKMPLETLQPPKNQEHYAMPQQAAPLPVESQQPKPKEAPVTPPEAKKPPHKGTPPQSPKAIEPPVPEPRSKPAAQINGTSGAPAADRAVQPPTNAVAPITKPSNPAAKLSYAQVLRQKMAAAAMKQGGPPSGENKPMMPLASPPPAPEPTTATAKPAPVQSPKVQPLSETRPAQMGGQPQGEHNLFVCRLPLGIAVSKVAEIFSKFGEVVDPGVVRVSTGPKNCFAHVRFNSEGALQKALAAKIDIGEETLKMELWRKREGPPPQHHRGGRQGSGGRQSGGGRGGGPGRQTGGRGGGGRQPARRQGSWDIA
ncbi:hypothetical protein BSKO_09547 [Bryopsis sp. KO-2023]|nr:hypothetical protein BSKO_09547 [Bryopsis sp. KO-2023]